MRVKFQFDYGSKLTKHQLDALRSMGVDIKLEDKPELEEEGLFEPKHFQALDGDLRKLATIVPLGMIRLMGDAEPSVLMDIMEGIERLDQKISARPGPEFNHRVEVAVPGLGLLMIREAVLAQDCCTDHLNDMLRDGWKILAICPQPDQRRPDYVLGRTHAEE